MRTWTVEFDFFSTLNGVKPMAMKTGFKTYEEALEWAGEHTTDGEVIWEAPMGMTLFEVIKMIAREHGYSDEDIEEDQFLSDIARKILDDCGDLDTVEEAIEQVEAFFE